MIEIVLTIILALFAFVLVVLALAWIKDFLINRPRAKRREKLIKGLTFTRWNGRL
jgi:hypothetical protein